MLREMYINGQDAQATWGVSIDDTSLSALFAPGGMKPDISNDSPIEHGIRYLDTPRFTAERDVQLNITLRASTRTQMLARQKALMEMLQQDTVSLTTRYETGVVYRLRYIGASQYKAFNGQIAKFVLRFIEPNTQDRGVTPL